jgi:hypothetical protein
MGRIRLIFIIMSLLAISCCKNEIENEWSNVTVIGKGLDCGNTFLIQFDENVTGLPDNTSNKTFYAVNLPEEYKVSGKKIIVEFREPNTSEMIVCTTMGIGYPQIYITKVISN